MREIDSNFQIVYYHRRNAIGIADNLLTFGYRQFAATNRLKEINTLKELCESLKLKKLNPTDERIMLLAFEHLIDTIRISICFENFFKGLLLANGYVVHKLDKNTFPSLSKEQFKRPILLDEVLKQKDWEINGSLNIKDIFLKKQIRGILKNTIGLSVLGKKKYLEAIKFSKDIYALLKSDFEYRNNLHYYTSETFSISIDDYDSFVKIIEFVNCNVVRCQNNMIEILGKEDSYKIKKITY